MHQIKNGYRGLALLFDVNLDRILFLGALTIALVAGAFFGSM